MTTNELFEALEALVEPRGHPEVQPPGNPDLIKELQVRQLELEIQNRELRQIQQQLAHSRTRYADLYDFSPIGYASLDENARIEEINITGGKLLGENPHKLIGRSFTDFIVPEDVQNFTDHLCRCRRSRQKRSIELRLMTRDAGTINVQLFTMATQDVDRHTLQFRTAILDITGRKIAEADLRRSQVDLEAKVAERTQEVITGRRQREDAQRFLNEASAVLSASLDSEITVWSLARAAIPHLADCCVVDILQDDGSIRRVAVAHISVDKEPLLWDLENFPDDVGQAFGRAKVIRTGRPEVYENVRESLLAALARDSAHLETMRTLGFKSFMCVPLIIRGETMGSIGLMLERPDRRYNLFDLALAEDLADRAAIALDNATLFSKEQEANRLKDEFLAMVSHELRTPLTPILGAIYKLRSIRKDDEDLHTALDLIERNAKAQARIVEDLLDISRITTGKLDFKRRPTDLLPIVEGAIEVIRPAAEALGIHLRTSLEEPRQPIWCDRDRIQQVVWNLVSNAIKFTRRAGTIEIQLQNMPASVRIRIADTGVGIKPEFLPHVFERFRQAGNFSTRMHGGLGVGLSIVRYIVERHGGSVRADSSGEGKGTTFIVDLPFSR